MYYITSFKGQYMLYVVKIELAILDNEMKVKVERYKYEKGNGNVKRYIKT